MIEDRNPYLILGIPYGTSRADANIAFARRSKALRARGDAGGTRMTDLTWALNQIDESITDPYAALHIYRVPVEPESGVGILNPRPEKLAGRGGDAAAAFAVAHATAVHDYLRYLTALRAVETALPEA